MTYRDRFRPLTGRGRRAKVIPVYKEGGISVLLKKVREQPSTFWRPLKIPITAATIVGWFKLTIIQIQDAKWYRQSHRIYT